MDLGLNGKIALVAAASKGLGRAVAEELAAEGASLVLCARGNDELQATCAAIAAAYGVSVLGIAADVAVAVDVARVVQAAQARFGRIDVLVTHAGGPPAGTFDTLSPEMWQAATQLLLTSVVELTRAHNDFLAVFGSDVEAQRTFQNIGYLLIFVVMQRHDTAFFEVHVGQHHFITVNETARKLV